MRTVRDVALVGAAAALWITGAVAAPAVMMEPCKLLTLAEAQTVLGISIRAPESTGALCVYSSAGGSGPTLTVIAAGHL